MSFYSLLTKQPRFSIITVVLNDVPGFLKTRNSIACQNHREFEWVVIDGGSTDGTIDAIKKSASLIARWISEKDDGIYDAMNKGIRLCAGKYVVFLNAGDIFPNTHVLEDISDHLSRLGYDPDIIFGGATLVLPNGLTKYRAPRMIDEYIWHGLPANHQATYYNRNRINDILYDTQYKICGDYYLVAKLFTRGVNATYLKIPLVNFRIGDTSYKRPIKLFCEPYLIQNRILNMTFSLRILSMFKRLISTLGLAILSQNIIGKLISHYRRREGLNDACS